MKANNPDHVVLEAPDGILRGRCKNCGATEEFEQSIKVDDFVTASEAFIAEHEDCQPE